MNNNAIDENPVGKLGELCQYRKSGIFGAVPVYKFFDGKAGFRCVASVKNYSAEAEATSKKAAKNMVAHKLCQLVIENSKVLRDANANSGSASAAPAQTKTVQSKLSSSIQSFNSTHDSDTDDSSSDPYALTLPPEESTAVAGDSSSTSSAVSTFYAGGMTAAALQQPGVIRDLLTRVVVDEHREAGSEMLLTCLLALKNPQIEAVFGDPTLTFLPTCSDGTIDENFQVFLEIKCTNKLAEKEKGGKLLSSGGGGKAAERRTVPVPSTHPNSTPANKQGPTGQSQPKSPESKSNQKQELNVFGGQGTSEREARDQCCWQAIEYLFYSGGFAGSACECEAKENAS